MNITSIYGTIRNIALNAMGVERDLATLMQDGDVNKAKNLFENNDSIVAQAIKEYNPETHEVMNRPNKERKGKNPYITQKLPRSWQRYINEVELFFLLGNPIKWKLTGAEEQPNTNNDKAFAEFQTFIEDTRFNTTSRSAKRLAGAETQSAKLYHLYRDNDGNPAVVVNVLAASKGYTLRPLFNQFQQLIAFGVGFLIKEGAKTVEHFDIYTNDIIYRCRKDVVGWSVQADINHIGKIPVIFFKQPKAWDGADERIKRDEFTDSKTADTNEYFADPIAFVSVDIVNSVPSAETIGGLIVGATKDSDFRYIEPPTAPEMKKEEKTVLRESILQDTFTPDFSYQNLSGMGTLSGEALKRALILGFMKRDNRMEIYEELFDREKNLILAIMKNITHISLRKQIEDLNIKLEFSEPFHEDEQQKINAITTAFTSGVLSLETAVKQIGIAGDIKKEIERINAAKQAENEDWHNI